MTSQGQPFQTLPRMRETRVWLMFRYSHFRKHLARLKPAVVRLSFVLATTEG